MKMIYIKMEVLFEKLTSIATRILGNPITFIIALILVLFWWTNNLFTSGNTHQDIGDIIFGTTFLSLFLIQKSFNRYSAAIHLKLNELISSHEPANNAVIEASDKTEYEIRELSKIYAELEENDTEEEISCDEKK